MSGSRKRKKGTQTADGKVGLFSASILDHALTSRALKDWISDLTTLAAWDLAFELFHFVKAVDDPTFQHSEDQRALAMLIQAYDEVAGPLPTFQDYFFVGSMESFGRSILQSGSEMASTSDAEYSDWHLHQKLSRPDGLAALRKKWRIQDDNHARKVHLPWCEDLSMRWSLVAIACSRYETTFCPGLVHWLLTSPAAECFDTTKEASTGEHHCIQTTFLDADKNHTLLHVLAGVAAAAGDAQE
ncbi:unnamed protein product, partial [Amoebophrya sp. A120]|eukprot:GSA120T00016971001.1